MTGTLFNLGKTYTFEAAHELPLHDGKCKRLHGHSYRVEVFLRGPLIESGPKTGMVRDFSDVSETFKRRVFNVLDHQYLNDIFPPSVPTTAENIAAWILAEMKLDIPQVYSVRVWETATGFAEAFDFDRVPS